jgi:hypothetical protein
MVSGDHFQCDHCDYEWRTKKDVGEPSMCPHCKNRYISNLSRIEREKERIRWERIRREKAYRERKRKLKEENERKIREKEEAQRKKEYEEKLIRLKKSNKWLYYLYKWRWVISIVIILFLLEVMLITCTLQYDQTENVITPSVINNLSTEYDLPNETISLSNKSNKNVQTVNVSSKIISSLNKSNKDIIKNVSVPNETTLPLNTSKVNVIKEEIPPVEIPTLIDYTQGKYSLPSTFMNYNNNWIISGVFETRIREGKGDNTLKSFIFTLRKPVGIAIPIMNGCYYVQTYHGDLAYTQGPHYMEVEGVVLNKYGFNEQGKFINFSTVACVDDGLLDMILGSSTAYLEEDFYFPKKKDIGHSMLNAIAIRRIKDDSNLYYINFGESSEIDEDKLEFLLNGLE